jgi:hypothetical protein
MLPRKLLATFFLNFIQNSCCSVITNNAVRINKIDCGAQPASYTMDTAVMFLGIKQLKLEADNLPPLLSWKISGAMSVRPLYALIASI